MENTNQEKPAWVVEVMRIAKEAAADVRAESKRLGLPLVYSKNGQLYYEMPDGTITTESPWHLYKDYKCPEPYSGF